ncbi:MAG: indolepyruvate ferredoxin oxidoreductase family protein [Parasphingorhabdus sp.]|uniref:indolepyruvate ferredoxin oxidoreductase family protein n=1 Tax=Parasphingorhabdus sp. TaxID=2709688 RepID=UPI003002F599
MLREVTLDAKYTDTSGLVYMSGIQALVRLPMLQRERDRAAELDTAGFISGYRGSPLGNYDDALEKAEKHLAAQDIHFLPGINEDIAATSLWGTQQVALSPKATKQGVFGIWYGKGPGVDRTMDVFKHANAAGTSEYGGVLAVMGDDHACKSSTLPHQSDQMAAAAHMPLLNPANVEELISFGLHGFALSRFSGCWVALKATTEIVESSAVVDIGAIDSNSSIPTDFTIPAGGFGIRWPDTPNDMEKRLHGPRMEAIQAFARRNPVDKTILDSPHTQLAVITTGKAHGDLIDALADLGIDMQAAQDMGIAIYKIGMSWPLEPLGLLKFLGDTRHVMVIEEKDAFVETQIASLLVNRDGHKLMGKKGLDGTVLLPSSGELDPGKVAAALVHCLDSAGVNIAPLQEKLVEINSTAVLDAFSGKLDRVPFFCSGCPHNTSTKVPEGSRAMAGIGCHGMAYSMPDRNTSFITQMGGEGASWIGQAPFTTEDHIFQNMGDGTYFHSGLMAIRAASAAGSNITYKILYNDAVAMTGGQSHDGPINVPMIAQQVAAEGAARIAIVSDEPEKYGGTSAFPAGSTIHHRLELDAVQRQLREVKGLSVIIYDQTCAAEKRRRRKRKQYPDPPKRLFINDLVCEGCGDCSVKSNCIAVKPLETEFGRKRQIDQSDCNKDYSCLEGFCPSFVTVKGGNVRLNVAMSPGEAPSQIVPEPDIAPINGTFNILVTGIGGTGVVTVGALIGMAAHLEGKFVTVLDNTGLAQKNGSVSSHIRLADEKRRLGSGRIGVGATDLLLACDLVVAGSDTILSRLSAERTTGVVNDDVTPTAAFVTDGSIDLSASPDRRSIVKRTRPDSEFLHATHIATRLMGDSIASNLFLLGFAWQRGRIPLSRDALQRAIELNGVAVKNSMAAFEWGRLAAHDMGTIKTALGGKKVSRKEAVEDIDGLISQRTEELVAYQDAAYADRYRTLTDRARAAEMTLATEPGELTRAVAWNFYKLLAYKDEYEVARLYTDGRFEKRISEVFEGDYKIEFNMAPPLLAKRDPSNGLPRKRSFGPWMMFALRILTKFKKLRGSTLDPFGYQAERRKERAMARDYEQNINEICAQLNAKNYLKAVAAASVPEGIAGYGYVKDKSIEKVEAAALQPIMHNLQTGPGAEKSKTDEGMTV